MVAIYENIQKTSKYVRNEDFHWRLEFINEKITQRRWQHSEITA